VVTVPPMPGAALVAAVVLNYRSTDDTVACLRALTRGTYLDLRVVVVDNDAPGPDHDALRGALEAAGFRPGAGPDGSLRLVASGGNLGYAGGNNVGLACAADWRPEFTWLLNPDIRVAPDTLSLLLQAANRAPDAAAIGPRVVLAGSTPTVVWSDGGIVDVGTGKTGNRNMGRPESTTPGGGLHDVDFVYGGALLLRNTALAQAGPLSEEWFMYFEETDYCRRLARLGWRLMVEPRARVENHRGGPVGDSEGGSTEGAVELPRPHYLYYMTRNKIVFTRRYGFGERLALDEFQQSFLGPWRDRVAAGAPDWLPVFDDVVGRAVDDADAGRTGRNPAIEGVPAPIAARPVSAAGAR
jgi:GT2 family glycosyltransferase